MSFKSFKYRTTSIFEDVYNYYKLGDEGFNKSSQ